MRNLKYIEAFITIPIAAIFFIFIYKIGEFTLVPVIIFILVDFLIKLIFKLIRKNTLISNKVVLIRQKKSKWNFAGKSVSFIMMLVVISGFLIGDGAFSDPLLSLIVFFYFSISLVVFSTGKGDFYIDKKGFIQPELLKANYIWETIENFVVQETSIQFGLEGKQYTIEIPQKTSSLLTKMLNKY